MKAEIIVVGAGHGGLIAGAKLASKGFNVRIYEKNSKDKLSWDWRDNYDPIVLDEINVPRPDPSLGFTPAIQTFVSPSEKYQILANVPVEKRHTSIERRVLVQFLVDYALNAGAEISFNTTIKAPLIKDGVIIGVKSKDGDITGDLIIDSAGVDSPIRAQLPESYGLSQNLRRCEKLYAYRAYYNKAQETSYWNVIIGYHNKKGIAWVNASNEYADVLIGCIDTFEKGEIKELVQDLREKYPVIGENLLRGGQVAPIPLRRTAPYLVGPNYAVIGDAAYMAIPLTGSGIDNALIAGNLLANTIINANNVAKKGQNNLISFNMRDLWPYQVQYYREIGDNTAFIDVVKDFIMISDFEDIDFAFKKKILKEKDFEGVSVGVGIKLSVFDLLGRLFRGIGNLGFLLRLGRHMAKGKKVKKHYYNIPEQYDETLVREWIDKGDKYFEQYYEIFEK